MPHFARCILLLILVIFTALSGGQTLNSTAENERRKTALLIVDPQVGVLGSAWDAPRVTKNIEVLVARGPRPRTTGPVRSGGARSRTRRDRLRTPHAADGRG